MHMNKILQTSRDPMGRQLAERGIEQHETELEELRAEADLRAKESPAQTAKRHEAAKEGSRAAVNSRRQMQAQTEGRRQIAEAERVEKLANAVRLRIEQMAEREWAKAQEAHPSDHDAALKSARNVIRREVNHMVGSRVWPEPIDYEFQRTVERTFKPKPTTGRASGTDQPFPSIPQPDPTLPEAPRQKSGRSGPSF